jgi:predicted nicotinamide N-methyase
MTRQVKTMIRAHGVRVLLSGHPEIRRLKRLHVSSFHGNRFWNSSWLLMDFFSRRGLPEGTRILDLGCGWGLTGIYCAKKYDAVVTGVDIDPAVFPYLRLHAEINKVQIATMQRNFGGLTGKHLVAFDVLVGADICFWDKLANSLKRLINRAMRAGLQLVMIADPGRPPFEELARYFVEKRGAKLLDWTVRRPRRIQGRILKVGSV